ncbi:hypothetical protein GWD52_20550 [Enterobacteriaceae bacterium 4M9]|nr:hypothetical protein [Enterobacteriaceae bacterium 4M9]
MAHNKPIHFIKRGIVDQVVNINHNSTAQLYIPEIDRAEFGDLTEVIINAGVCAALPLQTPALVPVEAILWGANVGGVASGFLADASGTSSGMGINTGYLHILGRSLHGTVSGLMETPVRLRISGTGNSNVEIHGKDLRVRMHYEIYAY